MKRLSATIATVFILIVSSCALFAAGRSEGAAVSSDDLPQPLGDRRENWQVPLVFSGNENPAALRSWEAGLLSQAASAWYPAAFRVSRGEKTPAVSWEASAPHRRVRREELRAGLYQYTIEVPSLSATSRRASRHTISYSRERLYRDGKPHTQPVPYAIERIILQSRKGSGYIRLVSIAYDAETDSFAAQADIWD